MGMIVHDYYGADLAVINIGDIFTTGPEEAAFAITELVRPASAIPSHVNEARPKAAWRSTVRRQPDSRTWSAKARQRRGPASAERNTMEFDSKGRCQSAVPPR
jgi:L-ascorbate metabolism protein UlaG (beta-lactamase superfamily)